MPRLTASDAKSGSQRVALVTGASAVSAALGYGVLVIVARTLTPMQNADFLVFWSAVFAVFGVISGIQNETTRTIKTAQLGGSGQGRPFVAGLAWGVLTSVFVAIIGFLWGEQVLGDDHLFKMALICAAAISYSAHCALAGGFAGRDDWTSFSGLIVSEAVTRVVATSAVALAAAPFLGFESAAVLATVIWCVWLATSRRARIAFQAPGDRSTRLLMRSMGQAMISSLATAILVTGYPMLIRVTSGAAEFANAAPLILAIMVTRAPILIPIQAMQGILINRFVGQSYGARRLVRPLLLILGAGLVAALGAYLLAKPVLGIFGPAYADLDRLLLAEFTFAAVLMGALTFTGTVTLGLGAHRWFAFGWALAALASITCLFLDLPLDVRVVVSLITGPVLGTLIHVLGVSRISHKSKPHVMAVQHVDD